MRLFGAGAYRNGRKRGLFLSVSPYFAHATEGSVEDQVADLNSPLGGAFS